MDWSLILGYILKGLGSLAATIIITLASVLFAKLKAKIKDTKIMNYIKEAVKAAEQLYPNEGTKMGPEKYAYVVRQTVNKFKGLSDNEYLQSLIEGAVFSLNKKLDEVDAKIEEKKIEKTNSNTPKLSSF